MEIIKPDVVYHVAAHSTQEITKDTPSSILQNNIVNTFNLVDSLPSHTHINFISSIVVYGNAKNPSENSPVNSTSLYGASKVAGEQIIKANYHTKGNRYNIFRLGALVGPGLTHGLLKDIINKLRSEDKELELWGDSPGSSKVYTHVDDIVHAITCDRFIPNETVNVCNSDDISVLEVAKIAMDVLKIHKPIVWNNTKTWRGDNQKLNADNTLIEDILNAGFRGSKEAVKRAVKEYR